MQHTCGMRPLRFLFFSLLCQVLCSAVQPPRGNVIVSEDDSALLFTFSVNFCVGQYSCLNRRLIFVSCKLGHTVVLQKINQMFLRDDESSLLQLTIFPALSTVLRDCCRLWWKVMYFLSWKDHIKFYVLLEEFCLSCILASEVLLLLCLENRPVFNKFLIFNYSSESQPKLFRAKWRRFTILLNIAASFQLFLKPMRMDSHASWFGSMMFDRVPHTRDKRGKE